MFERLSDGILTFANDQEQGFDMPAIYSELIPFPRDRGTGTHATGGGGVAHLFLCSQFSRDHYLQ